jgi:hypothetical protein
VGSDERDSIVTDTTAVGAVAVVFVVVVVVDVVVGCEGVDEGWVAGGRGSDAGGGRVRGGVGLAIVRVRLSGGNRTGGGSGAWRFDCDSIHGIGVRAVIVVVIADVWASACVARLQETEGLPKRWDVGVSALVRRLEPVAAHNRLHG